MLSRSLHDAIHILVTLALADPEPVRSAVLAARLRTNPSLTRRLLGRLARAGLVRVRRGPGGGALLARSASAIDLGALTATIEPGLHAIWVRRPGPGPLSPTHGLDDALALVLASAGDAFRAVLASTTVADLARATRRRSRARVR